MSEATVFPQIALQATGTLQQVMRTYDAAQQNQYSSFWAAYTYSQNAILRRTYCLEILRRHGYDLSTILSRFYGLQRAGILR